LGYITKLADCGPISGGALGAALAAYHGFQGQPRNVSAPRDALDAMQGACLGPEYSQPDIEARLTKAGAQFTVLADDALINDTATGLSEGKSIGWFQGRMEFGPRALGNRSILGDARSPSMQKTLNQRIKFRESFRPFAPSVLREDVADWFDLDTDSPYMMLVAGVKDSRRKEMTDDEKDKFGIDKLNVTRSEIPAVTHVDYSARVQTVHRQTNPRYHALISRFKEISGCPVIVNTSFNIRDEPIVASPEDAWRCFMGTELEILVIGNCFLRKEDQNPALKFAYEGEFSEE
jgi:carbamoyltransferase